MAALGSQTIAASYEQLLHVDTDGGGDTTTLVPVKDGDNGTTFCLQLATTSAAFESSTTAKPLVLIKNTTDDQVGAELRFVATQGGTNGVDNDVAGTISFYSNDDGTPTNQKFAQMVCKATDVTSGGEEGSLSFGVAEYDGTVTDGLVLTGQPADGEVDVTIGAGASSTTTIAGNLSVTGTGAGASSINGLSDAVTTATSNIGLGSTAIDSITTGDYNVGLGDNAGTAIADGDSNVAIGVNAAQALTSASNNISIGHGSLNTHTTGGDNVAIGIDVMSDTDAGGTSLGSDKNVFIGKAVASGTWTDAASNENVAIGYNSFSNALAGCSRNIFIGSESGNSFTGSSYNVAIGYDSAGAMTAGGDSVCIGSFAGNVITDGNANTLVGYNCDASGMGQNSGVGVGNGLTVDTNEIVFGVAANHIYTANSSASFTASSDERKKKNIQDVSLGLDFVNDLRTVTFQFRPNEEHPEEWGHFELDDDGNKVYDETTDTDKVHLGMIAQEVKAAMDTAGVDGENFGGWSNGKKGGQGIAPADFVYPLIKAVQELSAKVEALENA